MSITTNERAVALIERGAENLSHALDAVRDIDILSEDEARHNLRTALAKFQAATVEVSLGFTDVVQLAINSGLTKREIAEILEISPRALTGLKKEEGA